jgi:hypothetical protein
MDEKRREMLKRVCEREGVLNDDGYHDHHCFFRSEYKKPDWDEEWNHEPLHASLHIGGNNAVHAGNRELDAKLKRKALNRYHGLFKGELEQAEYGIK